MARIFTNGFETQRVTATAGIDPEGQGCVVVGSPTLTTNAVRVRSGECALVCGTGSAKYLSFTTFGFTGTTYFLRSAIRWNSTPAASVKVMSFLESGTEFAFVRLNTDDTLTLHNRVGTQVGSTYQGVQSASYPLVEVLILVNEAGNGALSWRIDGVGYGGSLSTDVGNAGISEYRIGRCENAGPIVDIDDLGLNNDTGGAPQNTWLGTGKVVLMKPTSDDSRTAGWLAGAGGTTNLWDALDNRPPVGLALASGTNTSQIKDAVSSSLEIYSAQFPAYTASVASGGAGMDTNDDLILIWGIARYGNSTATARNAGIGGGVTANPNIAENTPASSGTAGTDPTNWLTMVTGMHDGSGVALGTGPILRLRKGTASTDSLMFDMAGFMVEYQEVNSLVAYSRTARNTNLRR